MNISAENLVKAIGRLSTREWYEYISDKTETQVRLKSIEGPEGPIRIERRSKGKVSDTTISRQMLWRVANAIQPGVPVNLDRVLGGSYNTRSALETLLARTQEFHWCVPGRIELVSGREEIKRGHKHLVFVPDEPHALGMLSEYKIASEMAISELPQQSVVYDALTLVDDSRLGVDVEVARRHIQIQILLAFIGTSLGYRTWIAKNDRNHLVMGKPISEIEGVIAKLQDEKVLSAYEEAVRNALLIDAIWFKNGRLMPAVIEVEQSTGVSSGLMRMKRFQDSAPQLADIRWVVAAPDEDRDEVFRKARNPQFASLDTKYFPYSAIEELYNLCKRRNVDGSAINEKFLDCFMEPCL
jgi:type II restriction enzyme